MHRVEAGQHFGIGLQAKGPDQGRLGAGAVGIDVVIVLALVA